MESDSVLIVFVKNAIPGQVKTRLAGEVGEATALKIYHRLLYYTRKVVTNIEAEIQVWYSGFIPTEDLWDEIVSLKMKQKGDNLGERMQQAFESVFEEGYKRAVIIGSDCAELTTELLERAFQALDRTDVVVGPSEDGGYYLLGMKELYPQLFLNKNWSTSELYSQTMEEIEEASLTSTVLPLLNDVDTLADWEQVRDQFNSGRQL